ncbi:unnamed protein product [Gulo gulo]|uniref:Uncharacterized protein n=1 Tax=Gulo gulo TaxID=48420 RepID=A0A9X9LK47_GULGU|nr:unnamed protein product [Gulo gulo]
MQVQTNRGTRVGAANWAWLNPGWPPGGRAFKGGSRKSSLHRKMWHKEILTTAWPGGWNVSPCRADIPSPGWMELLREPCCVGVRQTGECRLL